MAEANWLRNPKRVWLRRALFQVHLWSGLILGLIFVAVSVSGSVLIFWNDIEEWRHPELRQVEATGERLPLDKLYAAVSAEYPEAAFRSVVLPDGPESAVKFSLAQEGGPRGGSTVHVDPYTGKILGSLNSGGEARLWWHQFHGNLLLGRDGRLYNGYLAIVASLMCLTGVVIWWPGFGKIGRALIIGLNGGWKRINWDLHNVFGFVTMGLLFVTCITAFQFSFPSQFRTAVAWFSGEELAEGPGGPGGGGPPPATPRHADRPATEPPPGAPRRGPRRKRR
ncbi:MAG: PepSY domain-containing protein, partial [bacterium]|nr:PepSY domain-containing protein [bacterium]